MYIILSMAIAITLGTSLFICLRWRNLVVTGPTPLPLLAFSAILFTSGLDVGLIMFPLVEFPVYASEEPYSFTNPLAIAHPNPPTSLERRACETTFHASFLISVSQPAAASQQQAAS